MSRVSGYLNRAVRSGVHRSIARLNYVKQWHLTRNPGSRRLLADHRPTLSTVQAKVVQELTSDGIAFVDAGALGMDAADWAHLRSLVEEFADSPRVREASDRFRAALGRQTVKPDAYIVKLHPEGPTLSLDDPLLRLALRGPILDVVNSYLGLWSKLVYTDVWHTIPSEVDQRIGSQFWHRDPEDRRMVKVYFYFSEVDGEAGPMEYVRGSASGGRYGHLWPWKPLSPERYPREEEVDRLIPAAARVQCFGSPGTLIFCDTDGLHRGGTAKSRPRIAATWTFVTPASVGISSGRRFQVAGDADPRQLSLAAQFALA
jgi:hypothetical protein